MSIQPDRVRREPPSNAQTFRAFAGIGFFIAFIATLLAIWLESGKWFATAVLVTITALIMFRAGKADADEFHALSLDEVSGYDDDPDEPYEPLDDSIRNS